MESSALNRRIPQGLLAGAPLSRIDGPQEALHLVADSLARAELALKDLVMSDVAEISSVALHLVNAGGKRLRPALTALGARAVGFEGDVSRLMCVGELIHLGSLLHDDVVDGADLRRGRPSAHRVHGNAATILSGDFCWHASCGFVRIGSSNGNYFALSRLGCFFHFVHFLRIHHVEFTVSHAEII